MKRNPWVVCLLKRGAIVQVDVNYVANGAPAWMTGTLVGVAQRGRLCRVRIDDMGDGPWAGTTNVHTAARVQAGLSRH